MKKLIYSSLAALMMLLAFMGVGTAQTVTFSPDPTAGPVAAGTTITISVTPSMDPGDVWFKRYANKTTAEANAANDFEWMNDIYTLSNGSAYLKVTDEYKAFAVAIFDNDYNPQILGYAEYTIASSGPSVTFSPDPNAGSVAAGTTITISVTPSMDPGDVWFKRYANKTTAEANAANDFEGMNDIYTLSNGSAYLKVTDEYKAFAVAIFDNDYNPQILGYAEYTLTSSGPSVTFSPDPNAGSVAAGTTITISVTPSMDPGDVWFKRYANKTTAEANAANDFEGMNDIYTLSNGSAYLKVTDEYKAFAVAIFDDNYNPQILGYAEYTIAGGETPGPDDPTPTTPINTLTFNPPSGEVPPNQLITIYDEDYGKVYYKVYATKTDAEADNASWDTYTNSNLTEYQLTNRPVIKENQLVIKANTWLEADSKWDVFSYAEYTIKTITPTPDFTLAFSPDNTANVESGERITITATPELTSDYTLWFQLYQTESDVETWNDGANAPLFAGLNAYYADEKPQISTSNGTVLKAGVFDNRTKKWVASSITVKKYTIGEAREPFVISFDPEAGQVAANTKVTLSTTPALSTGFDLYYQLYATESAATSDSWPASIDPMWLSATLYSSTDQPVITKAKPVLRAAIWNASSQQWESNTVVAYTTPSDTVDMPTFNVTAGEVVEGTKVTLSCTTKDAKIYYTVDGSVPTTESTEYTTAITIDKAMTIKAIAAKENMVNSKIAEAAYTIRPVSGKATVRLMVNGDNCPHSTRNQYQLLLDANHELADTYAEELSESYLSADILPRLYESTSATIPAGLSADNLAIGVDLYKESSVEVAPGLYDIFLLQSIYASWLDRDIIRSVEVTDGSDIFYVDNITLQAGLTYTFIVTFDRSGAHAELVMPVNLQLTDILGDSKPSCEMDSMAVNLSIANIGSIDVTEYEVYYTTGKDTVRETVNATLAAGKDTVFTFGRKLALTTGEKTIINAAVLVKGEVAVEDNFGSYTALRTESSTLPVQIKTTEMNLVRMQDWTLDANNALTAAKNASTPAFSTCFTIEDAGFYRLDYEYICGRYVELPDGEVLVNHVDAYKIRIGKTSEKWQEWPVVLTEATITGSSNYDEFSPKEVIFKIEEPGDYAFCIYADVVNDEDNLKFRNMEVSPVKAFEARFNEFSVRSPRIIPQDWSNATNHKINLNVENRGLQKLENADLVISVNGHEATRQTITLDIDQIKTLTMDVPVSGFNVGQTIEFSGKIVLEEDIIGETEADMKLLVSENTAAFDYMTDFSSVDGLQSYTGARIGLIFPVVKTDTITAVTIGWGEMDDNTEIGIAIQRIRKEDGKFVLGDMIYQTSVRRGLASGLTTYEIPAFLLTPDDYFVSVEQLDKVAFNLAMDKHPDGGFYSYDIAKQKWTYYTQAGYPALRTVFGSNGKLVAKDAMVTAISKPIAGGIFADNEPIVVSVRNNGIETAEFPVYVRVDNTVLEPKTVTLPSYATVDVTFNANLAANDADRHIVITAFTALSNDNDRSNDTLSKEVISFVPADPYRMDFESCLDFATEGFNPAWTSLSFDDSPVLPLYHVLNGEYHYVEFPGSETDLGFIAFNPYTTEPSMLFYEFYDNCRPHSGVRFGASLAIANADVSKDDWLISPKLKMPAQNTQLSMWVKSFDRDLRESYEIWVSEGSGDPLDLDFVRVYPEDDYETLKAASEKWENVVFDLSQYNSHDIHVAIRCMSPDATMFMIDDIVIGENAANEQAQTADFRVSLYPNPVQDIMTILSPDASIKEVAIFNPGGILVHRSANNLGTGNYRYNAGKLTSGMYFVRVTTDKGTAVRKFIVR